MKKVILLFSAGALIMFSAFVSQKKATTMEVVVSGTETAGKASKDFNISTSESTIKWSGKKVTGQHHGTVNFSSGKLTVDNTALVGGEFEVDMTSLTVKDLTDEKMNGNLTGHLKSDDFFSVEKNPKASFKITKAEVDPKDATQYTITGDLTIKGITKPQTFPAKVFVKKDEIVTYTTIKVDRTLYDVRYGSGKFFEGLGDKAISDEFELDIRMVVKK